MELWTGNRIDSNVWILLSGKERNVCCWKEKESLSILLFLQGDLAFPIPERHKISRAFVKVNFFFSSAIFSWKKWYFDDELLDPSNNKGLGSIKISSLHHFWFFKLYNWHHYFFWWQNDDKMMTALALTLTGFSSFRHRFIKILKQKLFFKTSTN